MHNGGDDSLVDGNDIECDEVPVGRPPDWEYVTFKLAEVAVPRELFAAILERIDSLRWSPETG